MKIAIPAQGNKKTDFVDDRFGRARYYMIYDDKSHTYTCIENEAKDEVSGAGGQAIRLLAKQDVDIVLVPEVGPKALEALKAFELKAYQYQKENSIEGILENYQAGNLPEVVQKTHDGHHGLRRA